MRSSKTQDAKAKQSSDELNGKIKRFLATILSDALSEPSARRGETLPAVA